MIASIDMPWVILEDSRFERHRLSPSAPSVFRRDWGSEEDVTLVDSDDTVHVLDADLLDTYRTI